MAWWKRKKVLYEDPASSSDYKAYKRKNPDRPADIDIRRGTRDFAVIQDREDMEERLGVDTDSRDGD